MEHKQHKAASSSHQSHNGHYKHLIIMIALSFVCMYILMYAMVDSISNVFPNINQFYMAGLMTMPMIPIEMMLMRKMFPSKKINTVFIALSIMGGISFFLLIRQQTAVSDRQFLKSMIPHHAGAILMCEKSNIKDPEIIKLCEEIRASQQREIAQMKAKLKELQK
jgi:uncharacterized protein (DUF305 family)